MATFDYETSYIVIAMKASNCIEDAWIEIPPNTFTFCSMAMPLLKEITMNRLACFPRARLALFGIGLAALAITGVTAAHAQQSLPLGNAISSYSSNGLPFYTSGYASPGDGGQVLMVPATALLRPSTGAADCSTAGQCVTDGVTTNGSTTISSSSAVFYYLDQTRPISDSAGCVPANDTIASVTDSGDVKLATAATCTATNDTFNFGSVVQNSPGYQLDGSTPTRQAVMFAPSAVLTPQMFGCTSPSSDCAAGLNEFLAAVVANTYYGTRGYLPTSYFALNQLNLYFGHGVSPHFYGNDAGTTVITFPNTTASPNFLEEFPNGTGHTAGGGQVPSHSLFHLTFEKIRFVGNVNGVVAAFGDPTGNSDALNDAFINVSASNSNPLGTACQFSGIYNSQIWHNCSTAARSPASATDGVISGGSQFSSSSLGLSAGDVGYYVVTSNCPADTNITSVAGGVAQLSETCTNGSGLSVTLKGGTAVKLVSVNTVNFFGICSTAAHCYEADDYNGYRVVRDQFNDIDFDGSTLFDFWSAGSPAWLTFINGNAGGSYLACLGGTSGGSRILFTNPPVANGTNLATSANECGQTLSGVMINAGLNNLTSGTIPNPMVSGTIYTNASGQGIYVYGKNQTQTGVLVSGTQVVVPGVANWFAYVPPGGTISETCSSCGATISAPAY